jgi:tRNA(Ile)-lysidine synthase
MIDPSISSHESTTIAAFERFVAEAWPPASWSPHRLLIACSGGPDSIALLRALHRLAGSDVEARARITIVHIHHGLRDRAADDDQEFVASLAMELQLPFFTQRLDGRMLRERAPDGIESALREARYRALIQIAHQQGARYLATGHTRDDHIETVLFRIFRGTGMAGLAGIPTSRLVDESLTIVRPLRTISRAQVEAYLLSLGQAARSDASNMDVEFSARNWIRQEILPRIRDKFGTNVDVAIEQLAILADETQRLIASQAVPLLESAIARCESGYVVLRVDELARQPPILAQAALQELWRRQNWPLQEMNFDKWRKLVRLLNAGDEGTLQTDFPGAVRVVHKGDELHLVRGTNTKISCSD